MPTDTGRRSHAARRASTAAPGSRSPPTYGYHNTFHTHATPASDIPPPSYAAAVHPRTLARMRATQHAEALARAAPLPAYSCSVAKDGVVALRLELVSPFAVSRDRQWTDAHLVLRGTQLVVHRPKSTLFGRARPGPGKPLKTFSLQHAEAGLAADFRPTPLVPRSPFAHLVPQAARPKLYETDPHLFEPVREHVLRLRAEGEQFLVCCPSQHALLDWVDALCAAIDISAPLEDRSEPRYRSLPRRTRRQRALDGHRADPANLAGSEAGRRILAEQERILREQYPNLADADDAPQAGHDPDTVDLDPDDVRFPLRSDAQRSASTARLSEPTGDPKTAPVPERCAAHALRYRRRCAPVLLATSPRVSDVVFMDSKRMRILVKDQTLVDYAPHPPRYDAHAFARRAPATTDAAPAAPGPATACLDADAASLGADLTTPATTRSSHAADPDAVSAADADDADVSEPPSPSDPRAGLLPAKDAQTGLVDALAKPGRDMAVGVAVGVSVVL